MSKTDKVDLYKEHKAEYVASVKAPALVEVSPARYLTVAGRGEPGDGAFTAAVAALYGAAFTIKMSRKFAGLRAASPRQAGKGDYKVCGLEGLWWGEGEGEFFNQPRQTWYWKLLIRTPDSITAADLKQAKAALAKRGKGPECQEVKLETIKEGLCVQMLHAGPYATEPQTISLMRQFAEGNGLTFHGLHHEIYLSDPRRVAPQRVRTILRIPVRRQKAGR